MFNNEELALIKRITPHILNALKELPQTPLLEISSKYTLKEKRV
jgi:hypothetical protein